MENKSKSVAKVEMVAKVIRADGTEEDLGVIASWHRNPFQHALAQLKLKLGARHGNQSRK